MNRINKVLLGFMILSCCSIFAQNIVLNEIMASNHFTIHDSDGDTPDYIELYNRSNAPVNLEGYGLSDDLDEGEKWQFGSVVIEPDDYLIVFASDKDKVTTNSQFHTNFKISASGETIVLYNELGVVVDLIDVPNSDTDISYCRETDGGLPWLFKQATPGFNNDSKETYTTSASPPSGFYPSTIRVELSASHGRIFYTLDGSDPDSNSTEYFSPIEISKTTVIKAINYKNNHLPEMISYFDYFINVNTDLPVISLSTDPDNLWSWDRGIFRDGAGWTPEAPHYGANYWKNWEYPAHIAFYDENQTFGFAENCAIAIYGGYTRAYPQKSLSVKFKNSYGGSAIEYPLFPDFDVTTFKSFVLRNSGNDFGYTHIRDAFMQRLVKDLDIDYLEYRPVTAFIDGYYWGIYNIREKISEHYIANRHGVDPDNIDMLEAHKRVIHGDADHYEQLENYIKSHDMNTDAAYQYINQMIDLDECLLYFAAEAYFNNRDWLNNNLKIWRERTENGKWRWILYDLDFGFNRHAEDEHTYDHIAFMFDRNGNGKGGFLTLLQRKLVENENIKKQFINQIADLLNTNFEPQSVITLMQEMADHISNEIPKHNSLFEVNGENLSRMITFAIQRPDYLRDHIRNYFHCGNNGTITLDASPGGSIQLNTLKLSLDQMPWSGTYFKGNEITAIAISDDGYQFDGWSGSVTSLEDSLTFLISDITNLNTSFSIDKDIVNDIVMNEINYNSSDLCDTEDWIEFYNTSPQPIDMSGWIFSDSDPSHQFIFASGTYLEPDHYLVLVRDTSAFKLHFPFINNYIGEMDFGLSGSGELLKLTNKKHETIDSLVYRDELPWPEEPDGNGPTLILLDPMSDNSKAWNWGASTENGSPGMANDITIISPEAEFFADILTGVIPLSVHFTDSSRGTILSRMWCFGDDSISYEQHPTHTYVKPDTYTVSLCVNGPKEQNIKIKENLIIAKDMPPMARFYADTSWGYAPLTVHFSDSSEGTINSWFWDFGDDSIGHDQHAVHTYLDPDTYSVTLTVSGSGGSDSEVKGNHIIVLESPPVAQFYADTTIGHTPLTVHFQDRSTGRITSWFWEFGDGNSSQEQHPMHTYQVADTYSVSLTVTGPLGGDACIKENYVIVTNNAPIARFNADTLSGIVPLTVQFSDSSIGVISHWFWHFGDDSTSDNPQPLHTYIQADTYSVSLTVTGPGGSDTNTRQHYIIAKENPPRAMFFADSTWGPIPLTVHFSDTSSGTITARRWYFGDGSLSEEQHPTHVYELADTFDVTLIVTGPWGSDTLKKENYIYAADLTGIDKNELWVPIKNVLYQNYPNPFNPSTQISYGVEEPCHVYLCVYNINGQVVKRLVDVQQQPGEYAVNFDTRELASGIYIYAIKMGSFVDVRKMIKLE